VSLNYDLHNHSYCSDGAHSPSELVAIARAAGTDVLALTDHDCTDGIAEATAAAVATGLHFVPGVEVSVTWEGTTIHIVGLAIDPAHPTLVAGLASIRDGRIARAREMAKDFDSLGITGTFEGAYALAENKVMLGRTHFARHLVDRGIVRDIPHAFERFLVKGRAGYVAHEWASLTDAVQWICAAGGIAVIAHPGRYKITHEALLQLIREFIAAGGEAIEVVTGSHSPDHFRKFARIAREYGLLASRGADFHGLEESPFRPGTLPPLPADLTPVWSRWATPLAGRGSHNPVVS
jgi:3',5'-nucleoside bisphosphate phosphatase